MVTFIINLNFIQMKKNDLSRMQMSLLSDKELTETEGGFAWISMKTAHAYMKLLVQAMMVDPLKELGHGLGRGLAAGIKDK
jgi:hypothetical protein